MKRTWFLLLFLFLLLFGLQVVVVVEANFLPVLTPQPAIVILDDGSINLSTAPIQRDRNVYRLTDNIEGHTIAIQRDNVILDGNGYTLQGNGNSTGVFIKNQNNVTVRNMKIRSYSIGIRILTDVYMEITGNHKIEENSITDTNQGIYILHCSNNVLKNNHLNNAGSITVSYSPMYSDITSFINDINSSNTVNGKPIIYWINQHYKTVPQGAGQINLINCTNIKVQDQNLAYNNHGIMLVYTNHSTITRNNIATNNDHGVYIYKSSDNTITENKIRDNGDDGVHVRYSTKNTISGNTITVNNHGIYFYHSSQNNIYINSFTLNNQGIYISGSPSTNNSITDNVINENNEYGITLSYSSGNKITENYVERNGKGIFLEDSSNNKIIGNTIKENDGWAIRLEDEQRDNIIYHNYFIENKVEEGLQVSIPGLWTPQTWDPGNPNIWDDGKKGNYWSDYLTRYPNATVINETGIGDIPFYINPNNIDNYPIIEDDVIPEFPSWITLPLFLISTFVIILIRQRFNIKSE